jgi:hypothetical protein
MKHFRVMTKPFSRGGAELRKHRPGITLATERRAAAVGTGDRLMRPLSLILAAALVVAGSSMAGSSESGLPGVGTFTYVGTAPAAPSIVMLAAR